MDEPIFKHLQEHVKKIFFFLILQENMKCLDWGVNKISAKEEMRHFFQISDIDTMQHVVLIFKDNSLPFSKKIFFIL